MLIETIKNNTILKKLIFILFISLIIIWYNVNTNNNYHNAASWYYQKENLKDNNIPISIKLWFNSQEYVIKALSWNVIIKFNNTAYTWQQFIIQETKTDKKTLIIKDEKNYILANNVENIYLYNSNKEMPLIIDNWNRTPSRDKNKTYNDNKFMSSLNIKIFENKSYIINILDIDEYMKGMAEAMEKEPIEKAKALATTIRSYALYYTKWNINWERKFKWKPWDGTDNPNEFQKYLWWWFSQRSPQWQKALKDTYWEVIMYKNEVLRAAYFSCTPINWKTKTPIEANWNSKYFIWVKDVYQSVEDKEGVDEVRANNNQCWHWVWMSWKWAKYLAEQWLNYKEILNNYYKNIEIKKIH